MKFDGDPDGGYDALKEWIAFVLDPARLNDNSVQFPLPPEYLRRLTKGEFYPFVHRNLG